MPHEELFALSTFKAFDFRLPAHLPTFWLGSGRQDEKPGTGHEVTARVSPKQRKFPIKNRGRDKGVRPDKGSWKSACLPPSAIVSDGIRVLNRTGLRLVMVVDREGRLLGTVSDGDIRRGLLRGLALGDVLSKVMHRHPLVVSPSMDSVAAFEIMRVNRTSVLPVVDERRILRGLHSWDEIGQTPQRKNIFVIMAGGRGSRMMPFTRNCPKPMLLVDGKPMLEHILVRAREEGFRQFFLCIHYLGDRVQKYFRTGRKWGVEIDYVKEKRPLGTAGAVGLLPGGIREPVVITNGDVLTEIKYGELLAFHEKHQGFATMALQLHRWEHPFGVVEIEGLEIKGIQEKPLSQGHVNAGIYVLSPSAVRCLPRNRPVQMPEFFLAMKKKGKRLLAYPLHEPWRDVGRPRDLLETGHFKMRFKSHPRAKS